MFGLGAHLNLGSLTLDIVELDCGTAKEKWQPEVALLEPANVCSHMANVGLAFIVNVEQLGSVNVKLGFVVNGDGEELVTDNIVGDITGSEDTLNIT